MIILKFSNVRYTIGGGKVPRRVRTRQNYSMPIYLNSQKWILDLSDERLVNSLHILTRGKVFSSHLTTVKRKEE